MSPIGTMWGFQFWANLPAARNMMPPRYREVQAADIPAFVYVLDGGAYFDDQRDAYAYEVVGQGWTDVERSCTCGPETVILFEHDGERIQVTTTDQPTRFLLVSGKPLHEPVAWQGPIVMNTQEELRRAFEEFANGTFVKEGKRPPR